MSPEMLLAAERSEVYGFMYELITSPAWMPVDG